VAGAVLVTSALMLGVYTIVKAADYGWGSARTLGFGAVAIALLGSFVWREATAGTPLMPLRIFRFRNVTGANVVQILMVAGLFGMFFLGVLYLQRVLGYDAIETGVAFLPVSISIGVLSLGFSPRLIMRFGARATLLPGLVMIVAGLALFARAPVDGSYVVDVLPVMFLLGIGAGLSFPSLMTLAMSGATQSDSGLASGLVNTSLQVGGALGLAVLATLSTTRTDNLLADGEATKDALTGGYHLAFIIAASLVALGIVVATTVLQPAPAVEEAAEEAPGAEQALIEAA
jgi:fucose permease